VFPLLNLVHIFFEEFEVLLIFEYGHEDLHDACFVFAGGLSRGRFGGVQLAVSEVLDESVHLFCVHPFHANHLRGEGGR
jgi:hypothetical protein